MRSRSELSKFLRIFIPSSLEVHKFTLKGLCKLMRPLKEISRTLNFSESYDLNWLQNFVFAVFMQKYENGRL